MIKNIKNYKQDIKIYIFLCLMIMPYSIQAKTFGQMTGSILSVLANILVFIMGLIIVVFAWRMLSVYFLNPDAGGDKTMIQGRNTIFFTALALSVLLSIWGLAKILSRTLLS